MTARGIRNHNPGNIRKTVVNWRGMSTIQDDPDFIMFISAAWGIRAIAVVLQTYAKRKSSNGTLIDTIKEVIERWAPPIENNTKAYITSVDAQHPKTSIDHLDLTNYEDLEPLVKAIIQHENGEQPYPQEVIDYGLELANVRKKVKDVHS